MNLTTLARILKITPQELKDHLPKMGFDIGQKAIKIDERTAQKIIRTWPAYKRNADFQARKETGVVIAEEIKEKKVISIPKFIVVRDLASMFGIPASKVLAELIKSGIFTSLNERIDFDTAQIIGDDLNFEVVLQDGDSGESESVGDVIKQTIENTADNVLRPRPPVVVVMGHVDHGKTSLLDAIREANVMSGEAGGITQHIGAYQVERNGKKITFIDTPGHAAFTAMRSRGAKVADLAILVVAADDGIKPQTIESFNIIKAANIPFVVAMNKIDKEGADINRVKQELSGQFGIIPEDWGGKTICAPISAKLGKGIGELLDAVLLAADVEVENMKADVDAPALGTIIESHVDRGEGPVATILIQNGTLKVGDFVSVGNVYYGKVRALKSYHGKSIASAIPSEPAKIIGLKIAPAVGDVMLAQQGEKAQFKQYRKDDDRSSMNFALKDADNMAFVNVLIKTDVLGSGGAIEESLEKLNTEKVGVRIIYRGLGHITESDIARASSASAMVLGFNVKIDSSVEETARNQWVDIKMYRVIYDLIEDVKAKMKTVIKAEYKKVELGRLKVLAVFRTDGKSQIVGGKVLDGVLENNATVRVVRDGQLAAEGKIIKLQEGKEEVKQVEENSECGVSYEGNGLIDVGDILEAYKIEEIKNAL